VTAGRAAIEVRAHQPFYPLLESLARRRAALATPLLEQVVATAFAPDAPIRFALDATPLERCGRHVEGAGPHHHPTPGPAQHARVYGHVRVTRAALPRPPTPGVVGRPVAAEVYVRQVDRPGGTSTPDRPFQTPHQLAVASTPIDLAAHATDPAGWETITVWQYGEYRTQRVKGLDATWRVARGRIRGVIVEDESPDGWRVYFSADPEPQLRHFIRRLLRRAA
jgi:hypothetical protein